MLRQLRDALSFGVCRLEYVHAPLPELMDEASRQCDGPLAQLFSALARELEAQTAPDAQSCMALAMAQVPSFPDSVHSLLQRLGGCLGVFDLAGQVTNLQLLEQDCQSLLVQMEQGKAERLRSYQTLGLCAGAALAILFV